MALMDGTTDNDTLTGTAGNDTLNGLGGNDLLLGLGGNDSFNGGEGNDTLSPGLGNSTLDGGNGTDTADFSSIAFDLTATIVSGAGTADSPLAELHAELAGIENLIFGAGDDYVQADDSANRIEGGDGLDQIFGFGGNDTILGGNGRDVLLGNSGDDVLDGGPGDDAINPGPGNDTIIGGPGVNTLALSFGGGDMQVSLLANTFIDGYGDVDTLVDPESFFDVTGGAGNDSISGSNAANRLSGGGGNDTLTGLDGADTLLGGNGNDFLLGGDGNDSALGGAGNDSISGGNGNDSLDGEDGNDSLDGGPGDDLLIGGGNGNNQIDDLNGNDTVSYEAENAAIVFAGNRIVTHAVGTDTISPAVEQLNATFFADGLSGSGVNDRTLGFSGSDNINGLGGNDYLDGGRGDDVIFGGNDNDTLIGGLGNDLLIPEFGNNLIDATQGQDTVSFGFGGAPITVNPNNTVAHDSGSVDTILGSAVITGTSFNDTFNGGAGDDNFLGAGGNDVMAGGGGNDTLDGGSGNDSLNAGTGDTALLIGGLGNDTLNGSTTAAATASYASSPAAIVVNATTNIVQDGLGTTDTLIAIDAVIGSTHNDTLSAGAGLDHLVEFYGGGGDDSFVGGGFGLQPAGLVRVRYDLEAAGVVINLDGGAAFHAPNADILVDIHDVVGSRFADTISDSPDVDRIDAGDGDDLIGSNGGNDTILAGAGNDTVVLLVVNRSVTVDLGSGDDELSITPLVSAPPPQEVGASAVTTWQAVDAATLMVQPAFEDDVLGTATIVKSSGSLKIELEFFEQNFAIAAFQQDLILYPQSDLFGTLGMGDDIVIAASGTYSLDGGGGVNKIDYSIASSVIATFTGQHALVVAGDDTQNLDHFLFLQGTSAADIFTGEAFDNAAPLGVDTVLHLINGFGDAAPPTIRGGSGNDSYVGGLVADYSDFGGPVTITPGQQPGEVIVHTATGNDTLASVFEVILPPEHNTANLGTRNAVIQVTGNDNMITAGSGSVLSYEGKAGFLFVDLPHGSVERDDGIDTISGFNNVIGGAGDDTIIGNDQANIIAPGGGENDVRGGGGADTAVFGFALQAIADQVYFPEAQRLLFVRLDNGLASGQSVSEVETGNFLGESMAISNFGRALPSFAATTALDASHPNLIATAQNDDLTGSDSANIIFDQGGTNRVAAGGGNDLIVMTGLVGGAIANAPPPGSLALPPGAPVAGDDALSAGDGSDTVLAGPGADVVDGGAAGDLILGEDGADSIGGGDGDDLIFGGAGDDFLAGEAGNDTLFGDSGQDILYGGDGQDRLYVDGSDRAVLGGPSLDTLVIQGSVSGLSIFDLAAADNQNQSGSGPTIVGVERVDASLADAGVSVHGATFGGNGSTVYGSAFQDTIVGSDGPDLFYGNAGNDSIDGGLGADQIYVGPGNDTVTGGPGADSFYYGGGEPGSGIVQLTDFLPGTDHVVLPSAVISSANGAFSLLAMTGDGAILLLDTGAGILFVGVATASLSASDFLIEPGL